MISFVDNTYFYSCLLKNLVVKKKHCKKKIKSICLEWLNNVSNTVGFNGPSGPTTKSNPGWFLWQYKKRTFNTVWSIKGKI